MNKSEQKRPGRVVSVHFPKAAGSSLKAQFVHLLGDLVYLDYDRGPLAVNKPHISDFPEGKAIVHGHFPAIRYASTSAYMITFLREPIENLISIYCFWNNFDRPTNRLHARFLNERPSLLAFASYPKIRYLMSKTYFGSIDLSRLDFVGFYESREVDMIRLSKILDLPLDPSLHLNSTEASLDRNSIMQDAGMIRKLKHLLSTDISFYWNARRRFGVVG